MFNLSIEMIVLSMVFQSVVNMVEEVLREIIAENPFGKGEEVIMTSEKMMTIMKDLEIDINDPWIVAFYKNAKGIPSATCCAGVIGEIAINHMRQFVPQRLWKLLEWNRGKLMYAPEVVALDYRPEHLLDRDMLKKRMTALIGHERRHAVQPAEVVEMKIHDFSDLELYKSQRHERDAFAFQHAIENGTATIDQVETWPWVD